MIWGSDRSGGALKISNERPPPESALTLVSGVCFKSTERLIVARCRSRFRLCRAQQMRESIYIELCPKETTFLMRKPVCLETRTRHRSVNRRHAITASLSSESTLSKRRCCAITSVNRTKCEPFAFKSRLNSSALLKVIQTPARALQQLRLRILGCGHGTLGSDPYASSNRTLSGGRRRRREQTPAVRTIKSCSRYERTKRSQV